MIPLNVWLVDFVSRATRTKPMKPGISKMACALITAMSPRIAPAPVPSIQDLPFKLRGRNQIRNQNAQKYIDSGMKYAEYELIGPSTESRVTSKESCHEPYLRQIR